jgi:hypothetical protein
VKLPGFERAIIEHEKLHGYLLSESHPIGRFKAAFFASLGYSPDRSERLAADLRELIARVDAVPAGVSEYGQKYVVSGILVGPSGKSAPVATVWMILHEEDIPRFVTAYPEEAP